MAFAFIPLQFLNLEFIEGLANPNRIEADTPSELDHGDSSLAYHIAYGSLGDSDELRDLLTVKQSAWR